jgi:hypothetical protein
LAGIGEQPVWLDMERLREEKTNIRDFLKANLKT